MKNTMKSILGAILIGASSVAMALPIGPNGGEIFKVQWQSREGNYAINWIRDGTSGGSSGGGLSKWKLIDDVAKGIDVDDVLGLDYEWLDEEFYALCMEPYQGLQRTTFFEIVDVEDAPSSPGPMGQSTATELQKIATATNKSTTNDFTGDRVAITALQMAVWEAGQETTGGYDRASGSFRNVRSSAAPNVLLTSWEDANVGNLTDGYALMTVAMTSNGDWVDARRQDFFVFEASAGEIATVPVPVPAPMSLLGLGLVGMIAARKFKK